MTALLDGEHVVETDPSAASTLVNKGCFGERRDDGLHLTLTEAAYLLGAGRLEVRSGTVGRSLGLKDLIIAGSSVKYRFLEGFLVFRDLRNRGLLVKEGPDQTLLVHPRGTRSLRGSPDRCFMVARESDPVDMADLLEVTVIRNGQGIGTIVSVVDSDWDITHYDVSAPLRTARRKKVTKANTIGPVMNWRTGPDGQVMFFTRDRPTEGPASFMGTDVDGILLLSVDEGTFLFGTSPDAHRDGTDLRHATYRDLLIKGWLPKTGFKYGTHFRVYASGAMTGHSELLVHCLGADERLTWENLSRAIRLSHSVRKRMVFSLPAGKLDGNAEPRYIELEWTRP